MSLLGYTWYKIFNLTEFEALGLVSREYEYLVENLGLKTFLVTKGNLVSITYEGVMVSLNLNGNNPFYFDGHGIYLNASNDVFFGIETES